jgi:hypothetical protein
VDVLVIAVADGSGMRRVRVDLLFRRDAAFDAWFRGIPDLDAAEQAHAAAQAEADPRLGSTPAERLDSLVRARKIAASCRKAAYVSCAWLAVWPVPYAALFTVVAGLPWIAFALCWKYRAAFAIDSPGRKVLRGDLTVLLALPVGVLAMRALLDSHLVIVGPVFLPALALWCAMVWVARALGPAWRRWRMFPLLAFLLFPYAPSTIALADQLFDGAEPSAVRVLVLGKRTSSGKGASQYLRVGPWGLRRRTNEVEAKRDVYDAAAAGSLVCLSVHPGALGMPWYEVAAQDRC